MSSCALSMAVLASCSFGLVLKARSFFILAVILAIMVFSKNRESVIRAGAQPWSAQLVEYSWHQQPVEFLIRQYTQQPVCESDRVSDPLSMVPPYADFLFDKHPELAPGVKVIHIVWNVMFHSDDTGFT